MRLVLHLPEFVTGIARGDISLIAPIADLRRGLLRLYLSTPVRRSTHANRAASSEWDRHPNLQTAAAAGASEIPELCRIDRHTAHLDRVVSREDMGMLGWRCVRWNRVRRGVLVEPRIGDTC